MPQRRRNFRLARFVTLVALVFVTPLILVLVVALSADPWQNDAEIWVAVVAIWGLSSVWFIRYSLARRSAAESFYRDIQQAQADSERLLGSKRLVQALMIVGVTWWTGAALFLFFTDHRQPVIFILPAVALWMIWSLRQRHPRLAVGGCIVCAVFSTGTWYWGVPSTVLFAVAAAIAYLSARRYVGEEVVDG